MHRFDRKFFLVIIILVLISSCVSSQELKLGMPVPVFSLNAVRGGTYHLQDLLGKPILLSFINGQADGDLATADPSRAQIVFLKSMHEQYGPKGLNVLIIDATRIETGKRPNQEKLIKMFVWEVKIVLMLVLKCLRWKGTKQWFMLERFLKGYLDLASLASILKIYSRCYRLH